jgi:hypothetical protein
MDMLPQRVMNCGARAPRVSSELAFRIEAERADCLVNTAIGGVCPVVGK